MRRVPLLALIAVLTLPASAAAQAPVCTVPGPEARAEWRLQEDIQIRGYHGFQHDRAYVEALTAQGLYSRRHGIHVTGEEERYLDRYDRLRLGAQGERYLRRRPEISAFWEVRDDWPRGPYVAVFVADDPARHRAAIKRLATFPRETRVVRVRYSDRAKERVGRRIDRDRKTLETAGFNVIMSGSNAGQDSLHVELVTRRTDHARYFARRYGPMVKTRVVGTTTTVLGCADATEYEIAPDGMSLTVTWREAPKTPARIDVTEGADRVSIGVVVAESAGFGFGFGDNGGSAVVKLNTPLGARAVYDGKDGSRMLQTGPSPGDPPCPVATRLQPTPLEAAIAERARYGMATDPAYVQSLLDRGERFTPHEALWLKTYRRLESDYGINDYLHHWSEDWGGNSIVGDYLERPYLLVRLLRNAAVHQPRIRKLAKYPDQLRFEGSTIQRDFFYDLPQHIGDDTFWTDGFHDGYGRAGFYLAQVQGHEETQSVDVHVITPRADAAEYFTRRYGPTVKVTVIGDRFECRGSYLG